MGMSPVCGSTSACEKERDTKKKGSKKMTIKIACNTNSDLNGTWNENEVKEEMHEVGQVVGSGEEWIEWVLDHTFDSAEDIEDVVYKAILSPSVQSIVFKTGLLDVVKITKTK